MFESSLTFSSPPTILDQFRKHFLAKFSLHTYESWLFVIYTEQPLTDRIRSKKRKKNSPSNPILFSPAGGYVAAACVARYGSFSFLRGVVAPIAAINRYSCACTRVLAWLCGTSSDSSVHARPTPRGRSFSAVLPPPLFPRGPILGMKFARLSPAHPAARNPWNPTGELPSGISATDSSLRPRSTTLFFSTIFLAARPVSVDTSNVWPRVFAANEELMKLKGMHGEGKL